MSKKLHAAHAAAAASALPSDLDLLVDLDPSHYKGRGLQVGESAPGKGQGASRDELVVVVCVGLRIARIAVLVARKRSIRADGRDAAQRALPQQVTGCVGQALRLPLLAVRHAAAACMVAAASAFSL